MFMLFFCFGFFSHELLFFLWSAYPLLGQARELRPQASVDTTSLQKARLFQFGLRLICAGFCASFTLCISPSLSLLALLYQVLFFGSGFMLSLVDFYYLLVEPHLLLFSLFSLTLLQVALGYPFHWLTVLVVAGMSVCLHYYQADGLGQGDSLLLGFWGLLLGFNQLLIIMLVASLSSLACFAFFHFLLKKPITHLPFVPFLTYGLLVCFYLAR